MTIHDPPPVAVFDSSEELPGLNRKSACRHENEKSPLLSERARLLLGALPSCQFFAPGGEASQAGVCAQTTGVFRPVQWKSWGSPATQ